MTKLLINELILDGITNTIEFHNHHFTLGYKTPNGLDKFVSIPYRRLILTTYTKENKTVEKGTTFVTHRHKLFLDKSFHDEGGREIHLTINAPPTLNEIVTKLDGYNNRLMGILSTECIRNNPPCASYY